MNNESFASSLEELNTNLTAGDTPFRFGQDDAGNYGYYLYDEEAGTDVLVCFKSSGYNVIEVHRYIVSNNATISTTLSFDVKFIMVLTGQASTYVNRYCLFDVENKKIIQGDFPSTYNWNIDTKKLFWGCYRSDSLVDYVVGIGYGDTDSISIV